MCLNLEPLPEEDYILRISTEPEILAEDQVVGNNQQEDRGTNTGKPDEPVERLRKLWQEYVLINRQNNNYNKYSKTQTDK